MGRSRVTVTLFVFEYYGTNDISTNLEKTREPDIINISLWVRRSSALDPGDILYKERKKNMKSFISVLLAIALVFCLAGCASKEEKEAAKAVSVQIENLADVTLEDAAAVQEAQEAYEALTDKARKRVKNDSILETAHMDLAEIVTGMISEIGTVTLERETVVTAAQAAYDSLPEGSRMLVTNSSVLETAIAELADLKQAELVTGMIDKIGTVTLDSEKAINAALAAYSAMTEEGKALVKNYAALETAVEEHREIFFAELNAQTDAIQKINAALNDRDVATVLSMIEEQLPVSEKLAQSKYYVIEEDAVSIMENVRDLMVEACYPNTHIISLDNLVKIEEVYNATADSNEGEKPNVDEDTGMDFYGYIYNTKTQMNNAFQAYTAYLDSHFELVRKKSEPSKSQYSPVIGSMFTTASAEYFYKDEQGHEFSVEWDYLDMGSYYGDLSTIYVRFSPEMGVRDSFGE